MAFDGRTDPDHGYEEKSPCTNLKFAVTRKLLDQIEKVKYSKLNGQALVIYSIKSDSSFNYSNTP